MYRPPGEQLTVLQRMLIVLFGVLMIIVLPALAGYSPKPERVNCNNIEPLECQEQLGDEYEVIYSPASGRAWGELK